ncbi:unnamed protein product [Notodromas monacha]|uniref:Methyltransferase n=1 Tax=Notodromas monacha TaxID=399045 RepID=A0A7R9BWV7_9CRUS|nr:unnamed protein product [Notodromas monacha]CAG0922877.1 unnamed protein product [Notodromas monacha]
MGRRGLRRMFTRDDVNNWNNNIIIAILEGHWFYQQPGIWKSLRGNSSLVWFKNSVMFFSKINGSQFFMVVSIEAFSHQSNMAPFYCAGIRKEELKVGSWILNSKNLRKSHFMDPYLCKALEEILFKKKSVLDLGCGIGLYGICFLRLRNHTFPNSGRDFFTRHLKGLKDWWKSTDPILQSWTGYDGTPGIHDLTAGLVKHMDLSKPGYIGQTFNWVLSLEVGEHIPRKYQANYISNLVRHAEEGIVLSWAIEGQKGRSHVNNRNNDVIIAILEGHGFYPQPEIWKSLRGNSSLSWFKNTVMHHQGSEPQYSFSLEQQYAWFQQQRDTAPAVQYLEEAVGVNFSLPHAPKAGKNKQLVRYIGPSVKFWMYQHHQGSEPQYSFSLEQQYAWFQQQRDTAPAVQYLEEAVAVNFSLPHAPKAGKTELETGGWILKPEKLRGAHRLDPYLCKALEETLFRGKSVLDLGCGIGLYGICFLRLKNHPFSDPGTDIFTRAASGSSEAIPPFSSTAAFTATTLATTLAAVKAAVNDLEATSGMNTITLKGLREWWTSTKPMIGSWTGYDGNPHVEDLTFGLVRRFDLSKPGSIGKTFDWVMSLEVGEHIPREYQDIYIDNLIRHAKEGIVLSWAVEGQGGRSHVNERNNDVIIEILQGRGFFPQPEIWKALRASSSFHWLKNTIMVFTRGEHFQVQ